MTRILQFADMVKKMDGLREAGGTLLDNCIMMWDPGSRMATSTLAKTSPS